METVRSLNRSWIYDTYFSLYGAVHKVRHARGGRGVREGVTVCDRGGVQEHVTSHFSFFFIHMKPKIESDV